MEPAGDLRLREQRLRRGHSRTWSVASDNIAGRAAGFGLPAVKVNGDDFFAVHEAASEAVARRPRRRRPDADRGEVHRATSATSRATSRPIGPGEVAALRGRARLPEAVRRHGVTETGVLDRAELDAVDAEVAALIEGAVDEAKAAPLPTEATVLTDVYVRY